MSAINERPQLVKEDLFFLPSACEIRACRDKKYKFEVRQDSFLESVYLKKKHRQIDLALKTIPTQMNSIIDDYQIFESNQQTPLKLVVEVPNFTVA